MRALVMVPLLALAVLAGCLDEDSSSDAGSDPVVQGPVTPLTYVVPEIPHVDAAELLADHAAFVRDHSDRRDNTVDHENARLAIMERFASYGLDVYRHDFENGIPQANILGIKWGHVRDQWVVVGGHYDIVNTPPCVEALPNCELQTEGAYDDGSGTMMSVHLGKAFGQANFTPYYTMVFVAYDGEERGLQGAGAFVEDFVTGGEDKVFPTPFGQVKLIGALDLDMIGLNWPGVMAPINVLTNSETTYETANQKRLDMAWPDEQWRRKDALMLGSSDYARFWSVTEENGGPIATMFFIADFEEIGAPGVAGSETPPQLFTPFGVYPFWHLEDTVETMTLMAGGQDNLEAGFQSAVDVAATVLHAFACQPTLTFDAVAV